MWAPETARGRWSVGIAICIWCSVIRVVQVQMQVAAGEPEGNLIERFKERVALLTVRLIPLVKCGLAPGL